jgi:peptide-O-fucosyltransferase
LEDGGWNKKFPPSEYKVLAFSGAPGAFPVEEKNVHLQKYLKWSDFIEKQADDFIKSFKSAPGEKFIALHLRNGIDFVRTCNLS